MLSSGIEDLASVHKMPDTLAPLPQPLSREGRGELCAVNGLSTIYRILDKSNPFTAKGAKTQGNTENCKKILLAFLCVLRGKWSLFRFRIPGGRA